MCIRDRYHSLTLTQEGERWHCRTIVAPARCYEPQPLKEGKKLWGTCVQLYNPVSYTHLTLPTSDLV